MTTPDTISPDIHELSEGQEHTLATVRNKLAEARQAAQHALDDRDFDEYDKALTQGERLKSQLDDLLMLESLPPEDEVTDTVTEPDVELSDN